MEHPDTSPVLQKILQDINNSIEFTHGDHIIHDVLVQFKNYVSVGSIYEILETLVTIPEIFAKEKTD